jgi:endonuclease/exonuclease/phosphatase family metal-dependent hydrolase
MKIKILSWNIWCGTYLDGVIKFLANADADIIALQEVSDDERGNLAEIIGKRLGYKYTHAIDVDMPLIWLPGYKSDEKGIIKMGNAILSKYKITKSRKHILVSGKKRAVIEAEIKVGKETLHVFSIHLKHNHQKPIRLQDLQTKNLLNLLSSKNTIVMGDFNAIPESSVIKKFNKSEKLKNTETNSNTPTWAVYKEGCICLKDDKVIYKLDYIYTSPNLETNQFKVYKSKASDHLPVSAVIEI